MENQKKLAQMRSSIEQLKQLTENIDDTMIYPISFFSQAYDLTGEIRQQLHEIEQDQVKSLDQQLKAHQAQMETITHSETATTTRETQKTAPTKPFVPEEIAAQVSAIAPPKRTTAPSSPATTRVVESTPQATDSPTDLRRLLTINERFRFAREFFQNDDQLMNSILDQLNSLPSIEASIAYMKEQVEWNEEEEGVRDFILFLEKRFH